MVTTRLTIRSLAPEDNAAVAAIIRQVMTEFHCTGENYSITDPEIDDMYQAYNDDYSAFFVVVNEQNEPVGCGGLGPLAGGPAGTCELRKMYLMPSARGRGAGKQLLHRCLEKARELGYRQMYLETVERMVTANALYQQAGFLRLSTPMGNTGHTACEAWYLLVF